MSARQFALKLVEKSENYEQQNFLFWQRQNSRLAEKDLKKLKSVPLLFLLLLHFVHIVYSQL